MLPAGCGARVGAAGGGFVAVAGGVAVGAAVGVGTMAVVGLVRATTVGEGDGPAGTVAMDTPEESSAALWPVQEMATKAIARTARDGRGRSMRSDSTFSPLRNAGTIVSKA